MRKEKPSEALCEGGYASADFAGLTSERRSGLREGGRKEGTTGFACGAPFFKEAAI